MAPNISVIGILSLKALKQRELLILSPDLPSEAIYLKAKQYYTYYFRAVPLLFDPTSETCLLDPKNPISYAHAITLRKLSKLSVINRVQVEEYTE